MRPLAVLAALVALASLPTATAQVPADVVINELYYDADGTDGPHVFTELYGPPGTSLDGHQLVGIDGVDGEPYRSLALDGLVLPEDGLLVLVTSTASCNAEAAADHVLAVDWQNGPDAVQLQHVLGPGLVTVVDAVGYGDAPVFAGEGTPAVDPSPGLAITRDAEHTDTDDNGADLVALQPTPGLAAAAPEDLADPDDDCYGNAYDNCPLVANPDQADVDENGVGDACEASVPVPEWGTLGLTAAGFALVAGLVVRRRT